MKDFGKYQLVRRIGRGGMAEVYLARTAVARGLSKELVIKMIHPAFARHDQFVQMFVTEAKIALGLNHPNIVQVFDFGTIGDTLYLAMEFVDGIDLLRLMRECAQNGQLIPRALSVHIIQEVAKGLDYAHRKNDEFGEPLGIVHRDISPQNVLISWDGAVKIVDFGIARAHGSEEDTGVIKGKYSYMSPEQARGEPVDRRSDIFSTGVVLYEMCCGRPPFAGRGRAAMARIKAGDLTPPRKVAPDLPATLEEAILKALATSPDERFPSAREMQKALAAFEFAHARTANDIIDPDTLARFLAATFPPEEREEQFPPPPRPITEIVAPSAIDLAEPGAAGPSSGDSQRITTHTAVGANENRQRKHVLVIEGRICGMPKLTRVIGIGWSDKIAASIIQVIGDIAFKHGAHVYQVSDEELSIVVGLPVASERDASRTMRLARALVEAVDAIDQDVESPLSLAVGIQRGIAVVTRDSKGETLVELAPSQRYLAQSLAFQAQGGEILVGSHVYQVARTEWSFDEGTLEADAASLPFEGTDPEVTPSGNDRPGSRRIRYFRLLGLKERADRMREEASSAKNLLGRELELKALSDVYESVVSASRKKLVILVGEAGIGKRTLVNGFLNRFASSEVVILRATPQITGTYTPYAVIADLARDLLGLDDTTAPEEMHVWIERFVRLLFAEQSDPAEIDRTIAAVSLVLGAESKTAQVIKLDAEELRQRLLQIMSRVEQYMAPEKPLLVVCEEMQWADTESLDIFLAQLQLPGYRPTMGIFTSRPDKRVEEFTSAVNADVIKVGELDLESSVSLIARRFTAGTGGDAPDIAEFARKILTSTGGNPFFIREVIDSLIERGIVAVDALENDSSPSISGVSPATAEYEGLLRWVVHDSSLQVPASIEALLSARIDRLPEGEREALMHAAVLGRVCSARDVSALMERDATADLASLSERALLVSADSHYAFVNDMSMSVAYGLLPAEERVALHRKAARLAAEAEPAQRRAGHAAVAHHLDLAGDALEAADEYIRAAVHAMEVGGDSDALRQLDRATVLVPATDFRRRFEIHRLRERILARRGLRNEQLVAIDELRQTAAELGDPALVADAYLCLGEYHVDTNNLGRATDAVESALSHARAAGDTLAEARGLRLRGILATRSSDSDTAEQLFSRALSLCDKSRDGQTLRAEILMKRGGLLWTISRLEGALTDYSEALRLFRELGLRSKEPDVLVNLGNVCFMMGELQEALTYYQSALKSFHDLGSKSSATSNIGQVYLAMGDLDQAKHHLHDAIKYAEEFGNELVVADSLLSLGDVHRQRGEYKRALILLEHALDLTKRIREPVYEVHACVSLVRTQLDAGESPERPLALIRAANAKAARIPLPWEGALGAVLEGLALFRLGRIEAAVARSAEAVALLEDRVGPGAMEPEYIYYIHAMLSDGAGRYEEAEDAILSAWETVDHKASRLTEDVRSMYIGSQLPSAIAAVYERLLGAPAKLSVQAS